MKLARTMMRSACEPVTSVFQCECLFSLQQTVEQLGMAVVRRPRSSF